MPVARELSILYGSFNINVANNRLIDGWTKTNKGYEKTIITFSFVIQKATEALFATEVAAVEAAFRQPFQDLVITQGSQELVSLKHSTNTGFNAKPVIDKGESNADTGRSRRYTVSVEFEMPADNVASVLTDGLRESTIDIKYSPSGRRTVIISGIFTALAAKEARAQYEATIDVYAASVLSGIGGDYEKTEIPRTDADGPDKLLSFTHIYEELIYDQADASPDDSELIRQQFSLNLIKNFPGDTPDIDVQRMVTVSATYNVWVDKSVTDLKTKWETIKTWIVTKAREAFSLSSVALVDENVNFNNDDNIISATLNLRGVIQGDKTIEIRITASFESTFGVVLVPAWTGDSLSKYAYQGPETRKMTITTTGKRLGDDILGAERTTADIKSALLGTGETVQISSRADSTPLKVGQDPYTHTITEFSSVDVYEGYNTPKAGAGTGHMHLPGAAAGAGGGAGAGGAGSVSVGQPGMHPPKKGKGKNVFDIIQANLNKFFK